MIFQLQTVSVPCQLLVPGEKAQREQSRDELEGDGDSFMVVVLF